MNINDLTIGQVKELSKIYTNGGSEDIASHYIGRYCIFRTYSAGVFFGILKSRNKDECIIENCRRIWSWSGSFTLSKVAVDGVESAKLSIQEPEKLALGVIEIIPASAKCTNQLKGMVSHVS